MASLKEIRARISSVASTQKITNAMKMVSAAKLKKAEATNLKFVPYKTKLSESLTNYLSSAGDCNIPLSEHRDIKRVALMVFSSNSGLCGVFNSNINKLFKSAYESYEKSIGRENIMVFAVGKKFNDYLKRVGLTAEKAYLEIGEKPNYEDACEISDMFIKMFLHQKVDKVELIYNHYKNTGIQIPQREVVLPISTDIENGTSNNTFDYIVEPSKDEFINELVPKVLRTTFFSTLLDSYTSEQGARTTAMHIASDNAEALSQELKIQYNKARQEVITNELIDIVGGAEALKG